jgi:hypothetical protein
LKFNPTLVQRVAPSPRTEDETPKKRVGQRLQHQRPPPPFPSPAPPGPESIKLAEEKQREEKAPYTVQLYDLKIKHLLELQEKTRLEHQETISLLEAAQMKEVAICVSRWRRSNRALDFERQVALNALAATKEQLRKSEAQVLKLRHAQNATMGKGFRNLNEEQLVKFAAELKASELSLRNWNLARENVAQKHPSFICTISKELMDDPVVTVDGGLSFERSQIKGYLSTLPAGQWKTPLRQGLSSDKLLENATLKIAIQDAVDLEWQDLQRKSSAEEC